MGHDDAATSPASCARFGVLGAVGDGEGPASSAPARGSDHGVFVAAPSAGRQEVPVSRSNAGRVGAVS
jgi:hypothetical protein